MYHILQFDWIYGVREVAEFDPEEEIDIISQKDVFYYLHLDDKVVYGCVVDDETYFKIDEEYGIH